MYALSITPCKSFLHAQCLREMLEGDGYPAIAATCRNEGNEHHLLVAAAEHNHPELYSPLAESYAGYGVDGLTEIRRVIATPGRTILPGGLADPALTRTREALRAAVKYAADEVVTIEPSESAAPTATVDTEATQPVRNPAGGGWEERCFDKTTGTWVNLH